MQLKTELLALRSLSDLDQGGSLRISEGSLPRRQIVRDEPHGDVAQSHKAEQEREDNSRRYEIGDHVPVAFLAQPSLLIASIRLTDRYGALKADFETNAAPPVLHRFGRLHYEAMPKTAPKPRACDDIVIVRIATSAENVSDGGRMFLGGSGGREAGAPDVGRSSARRVFQSPYRGRRTAQPGLDEFLRPSNAPNVIRARHRA